MKKSNIVILIIFFALIQATFLSSMRLFGVKPDLLLIVVVFVSLTQNRNVAFGMSLVCGVVKDSLGIGSFGIHTCLYPLASLLVSVLSRRMAIDTPYLVSMTVLVVSFFYSCVQRIIFMYLENAIPPLSFVRITFLEALYTALVVPIAIRVIKKVAYL